MTLKNILILVLALLQLATPLVHAHAAKDLSDSGLHIPGLEVYSAAQNLPDMQALLQTTASDSLIVSVDAGIYSETLDFDTDASRACACFFYQDGLVTQPTLLSHEVNFSPQQHLWHPLNLALSPHSPRAPPAPL